MKFWKMKARWAVFYRKSLLGRVIAKFIEDRVMQKAAGLSFTTLLALVPIIAVFLAFGGYSTIENNLHNWMVSTLLPDTQGPILESLNEFAINSRRLGTWGLLVSLFIIVLLLNTIRKSFNEILRTRPSKSFFTQISTYTSSLVFGFLIVGASITVTGQNALIFGNLLGKSLGEFREILYALFSISMVTITLILMFYIFPSGQLPFRSILPGALFGGICWEGAKYLFSLWASHSVRNSVIYGSLFLIPLMFIWVHVVWLIVLTSLEITYIHQHRANPRDWERRITLPRQRVILSLEMILEISRRFMKRQSPPQLRDLCVHLHLSERNVLDLLQPFQRRRLIYSLEGKQQAYLPGTDLGHLEIKEIFYICLNGSGKLSLRNFQEAKEVWDRFTKEGEKELQNITLGEWIGDKLKS